MGTLRTALARSRRKGNTLLRRALFGELGKGKDGKVYPLGADKAVKVYK